jgi:uncharacterized membrane protein
MPSSDSQRVNIMLLLVAPEVIEQSGATTASDIWYVGVLTRLSSSHALTLGASVVLSLSF